MARCQQSCLTFSEISIEASGKIALGLITIVFAVYDSVFSRYFSFVVSIHRKFHNFACLNDANNSFFFCYPKAIP